MSLVAYDSSEESENEEEVNEEKSRVDVKTQKIVVQDVNKNIKLQLPTPKIKEVHNLDTCSVNNHNEQKLDFNALPKPKSNQMREININETDSVLVPNKINYGNIEKPPKKEKGPTRILIPSLADFKDLEEEENGSNHIKRQPSQKKSGLISILPPPKCSALNTKNNLMVPNILTKKPSEIKKSVEPNVTNLQNTKRIENSVIKKQLSTLTLTSLSNYKSDSDSEDDKESSSEIDFFSLSNSTRIPNQVLLPDCDDEINAIAASPPSESNNIDENLPMEENKINKTLTSNVINLPKEDILLKNKAEVGPKLPIPEQEYNVDSKGNVAFDEKAIEYLCGKRGVKRKNEFNNVDIIEISGEDIKPDEREWMIKALTDETIQKPISIGAGPSGQSKKKHQITYLAHQAKAMELELKNQWAQNKASRQQTRSKYGF